MTIDNKIRWCASDTGQVIASIDRDASATLPADGQTPAAGAVMFASFLELGKALSADGLTLAVVGHGLTGDQFSIFRLDAARRTVTPLAKDVVTAGTLSAGALARMAGCLPWAPSCRDLSPSMTRSQAARLRTMVPRMRLPSRRWPSPVTASS